MYFYIMKVPHYKNHVTIYAILNDPSEFEELFNMTRNNGCIGLVMPNMLLCYYLILGHRLLTLVIQSIYNQGHIMLQLHIIDIFWEQYVLSPRMIKQLIFVTNWLEELGMVNYFLVMRLNCTHMMIHVTWLMKYRTLHYGNEYLSWLCTIPP